RTSSSAGPRSTRNPAPSRRSTAVRTPPSTSPTTPTRPSALLDGAAEIGAGRAAEIVALLSEETPREYGDDLTAALRAARRGGDAYSGRWRGEVRRLRGVVSGDSAGRGPSAASGTSGGAGAARPGFGGSLASGSQRSPSTAPGAALPGAPDALAGDDRAVGLLVALAFPERLARLDGGSYLMLNGTRAELREGSVLRSSPWLAVAVADRPVGRGHARVQGAVVVDEEVARRAAGALSEVREEVRWVDGDVVARRVERLGAVEVAVRPLRDAGAGVVRAALVEGLRQDGFGVLRWSEGAVGLRRRLAFLRVHVGEPWPDVTDSALLARVEEWLEPELSRARRRADLARIDAGVALGRLLPWASGEAGKLDALAPERITVPSGSRIQVDYSDPERPVLAVKLQEMFGLQESPRVAGVPVVVHLLSPAGRPAAVTADLASFWRDGYRGVRAELRGRYPKHPWPEDPATAEPTRHTNARLRG
ncbi:ATP-dependent helicase C-terminal domain-containing protein, partial [Streptomyces sp. S6]